MLNKIERLWAFIILFINGWTFALPITNESMPIWLTPVQLIHGVFIHELLLMAYLGFMVATRGGYLPIRQNNTIISLSSSRSRMLDASIECRKCPAADKDGGGWPIFSFSRIFINIRVLGEEAWHNICSPDFASWNSKRRCSEPLLYVHHKLHDVGELAFSSWSERARQRNGDFSCS